MRKLLTYRQTARALKCSARHVRRLLKKHHIDPIRIGYRTVRVPADKVGRLVIRLVEQEAE
jgi:excisionase family DNA binding protein